VAEDRQQQLLEAIARAVGVTPCASGVTVGTIWMRHKANRPRGRAWQMERNLLRPFVVAFWRRPAASLRPADWNGHRARRRTQRTRLGRPPCDLTLNLELKSAKRLLLPGRPFADCRPVKTRSRRGSWFTAEQVQRLVDAARALRWSHQTDAFAALASVMGDTGLRISEALALRWDRITLDGTTSVIGKGSKTRVVGLTPRALAAIGRLERHVNPHVFVNWRTGRVFNASTVRAWFRQAIAAAQLEGVKADGDLALVPHILRHSFASIADERGAPAGWIQAALGHAHASTTAVYLHRDDVNAARRMAAIMGERRPARRSAGRFSLGTKKEIASATVKRLQA